MQPRATTFCSAPAQDRNMLLYQGPRFTSVDSTPNRVEKRPLVPQHLVSPRPKNRKIVWFLGTSTKKWQKTRLAVESRQKVSTSDHGPAPRRPRRRIGPVGGGGSRTPELFVMGGSRESVIEEARDAIRFGASRDRSAGDGWGSRVCARDRIEAARPEIAEAIEESSLSRR